MSRIVDVSNSVVINDAIDLNRVIEIIYERINSRAIQKSGEALSDNRKDIIYKVLSVFDQVFLHEGASYSDIEFLGRGATSYVFAVKSKVVKIGSSRYTKNIRNNPYILQPVLRKSFDFEGPILEGLYVEVTDRVKACKTSKDVSDDELYELYAKFRDIDLEWVDVDSRNVGRLLQDNIINWKLPTVFENDFSSGEISDIQKAGDLVVLDTDFIYEGKAPDELFNMYEDEEWDFIPIVRKFRERYEREKARKK